MNSAKADLIGAERLDTLLVLAVGTEFKGTSDRVGDDHREFASWIGEGIDRQGQKWLLSVRPEVLVAENVEWTDRKP
jgi:hypothetical protein